MYHLVTQTMYLPDLNRCWCRLGCGHDVLMYDDLKTDLLGLVVNCPRCSTVPFEQMRPGNLYAVFLKSNPTLPLLMTFVSYRAGVSIANFQLSPSGRVRSWSSSEVAAVEES